MCNNEEVNEAFTAVKNKYPTLWNTNVRWKFARNTIFRDTMYTYLNPLSLFLGKRKYTVFINIGFGKEAIEVFSKEDLKGWFSHELAHIVDYETTSRTTFTLFVFRYLSSRRYRYATERKTNIFAYNNGFAKEFFSAAKVFYSLKERTEYRTRLRKNYRAPWESIKERMEKEGITEAEYRSLDY